MPAQIRVCELLKDSLVEHPEAGTGLAAFIHGKTTNPLAAYGGSDTAFSGSGIYGSTGLKLKHAHITRDLSIVYRIHGNPTLIDIYGVFSHAELGTSDNPNIKKQKQMSKRFSNAEF
jgi:hypothetical protein